MAAKAKKPAAVKKAEGKGKAAVKKPPVKKVKAGTSKLALAKRRSDFRAEYKRNGGNGYQAAVFAGYKAGASAEKAAERLSGEVGFREEIKADMVEAGKIAGLDVTRTLREIARLAYSDPRRFYNPDGSLKLIHDLDDDTAATIASVEVDVLREDGKAVGETVKVKQWDKNAALEKAMKFHGLYERDNAQRNPFAEMTDEQRRARIAELQARL